MKPSLTILKAITLLAVAAFCVFGIFATLEPTDNVAEFTAFRVGYCVIGLGCLVGFGFVIVNAARK